MTLEDLNLKIEALEKELQPLVEERNAIYKKQAEDVEARVKKADNGNGDFDLTELRFSRTNVCECGAGLAYPINSGLRGSWSCSKILLGTADKTKVHTGALPFAFYEIKSENEHQTTRPV